MNRIARLLNWVGLAVGVAVWFLSFGFLAENSSLVLLATLPLVPLALAQIALARPGSRPWGVAGLIANAGLAVTCAVALVGHAVWRFNGMEPLIIGFQAGLVVALVNLVAVARRRAAPPVPTPGANPRHFSWIGRTRGERAGNIAGLVVVAGFLGWKYLGGQPDIHVDIPAAEHPLRSTSDLQAAAAAFQPDRPRLAAAAQAVGKTFDDLDAGFSVGFMLVGDSSSPTLRVVCSSRWPAATARPVCEAIGTDFQRAVAAAPVS